MSNSVVDAVKKAGVVGAGGAGFPTHVKIAAKADLVIANGAECEPLIRVDQQLMAERAEQVMDGLRLVMETTGASRGVVALKRKYESALAALEPLVEADHCVDFFFLDDFYPAGDEHVLVHEVTGKVVPEGGIPLEVGVVVNNVHTLVQISAAVREGEPVISRMVTITGAVSHPLTAEVPVGTPIGTLIEIAGVSNGGGSTARALGGVVVVRGGPMMGEPVGDLEDPVTKTTSALIVLPEDHPLVLKMTRPIGSFVRNTTVCCHCRHCTDLCPRNLLGHTLEPHRMMRVLAHGVTTDPIAVKSAFSCSQCAVCEAFACPLGLSPNRVYARLKSELAATGMKPEKKADLLPDAMRRYRRIPTRRLISRLGLHGYDMPAPLRQLGDFVPSVVRLPLKQHIGVPAEPKVKPGDRVTRGQLIATAPDGSLGAHLHASLSGVVEAVNGSITLRPVSGRENGGTP